MRRKSSGKWAVRSIVAAMLAAELFTVKPARASWLNFLQSLGSTAADRQGNAAHNTQAVAGVRGWDKDAAAGDKDRRNYSAVDKMDRLTISEKALMRFIQEGHLAP